MPLIIRELILTIRSEAVSPDPDPTAGAGEREGAHESASPSDRRTEIVREAVEEVLRIQRSSKDR